MARAGLPPKIWSPRNFKKQNRLLGIARRLAVDTLQNSTLTPRTSLSSVLTRSGCLLSGMARIERLDHTKTCVSSLYAVVNCGRGTRRHVCCCCFLLSSVRSHLTWMQRNTTPTPFAVITMSPPRLNSSAHRQADVYIAFESRLWVTFTNKLS